MADITILIDVAPHLLCSGSLARVGDSVIIEVDQDKFDGASNIPGEISEIEDVQVLRRGCDTELVCAKRYSIVIDDSALPEGASTIENCDVADIWCADCCELWNRMEHIKVVLQSVGITVGDYYTQVRAVEDMDIYGIGVWIDNWPSVYGDPGPHTDVDAELGVSSVGGNAYSSSVAGTQTTLLRGTAETFKKTMLASPVRIDAGRQIYLKVTDDGGAIEPNGLGVVLYFRRANE